MKKLNKNHNDDRPITLIVLKKVLKGELKTLRKEINKDTKKAVDDLAVITKNNFEKVEERFEKVDERFDKIDERFLKVDERFEKMDKRFNGIDEKLSGMDNRIIGINSRLDYHSEAYVKKHVASKPS